MIIASNPTQEDAQVSRVIHPEPISEDDTPSFHDTPDENHLPFTLAVCNDILLDDQELNYEGSTRLWNCIYSVNLSCEGAIIILILAAES
jgi:hypothetical protein